MIGSGLVAELTDGIVGCLNEQGENCEAPTCRASALDRPSPHMVLLTVHVTKCRRRQCFALGLQPGWAGAISCIDNEALAKH